MTSDHAYRTRSRLRYRLEVEMCRARAARSDASWTMAKPQMTDTSHCRSPTESCGETSMREIALSRNEHSDRVPEPCRCT